MNTLRLYPKRFREMYEKNILNAGIKNAEKYNVSILMYGFIISILISAGFSIFRYNPLIFFISSFILTQIFFFFKTSLKASARIKKMEDVFPDVIQLMSSNLRAGMTVDRAFLLSARPEFYPLDQEIMKAGKEIATGKDIVSALIEMSKRISSEKISKTVFLIISGLRAGGNISALLEQTSSNMREKEFIEKRAASNILMYVIFIFFAVCVGAPILFSLSSILVEVILKIVQTMPNVEATSLSLPFTFTGIDITPTFIIYFSLIFLIATNIISSLVIGLVNKGDEKAGLKYLIPLVLISVAVFFLVRFVLSAFLSETLSSLS
jgi:pilus assembly protein TadC